ncbi:MAG: HAMP domain-containing histidine kinase [Candidatus Krumholzibacteriota bacterium]|nr:HAMP domain-containing histidine kinase [Candidatus Krumholzibacteriota bacterium]
MPLSCQDAQTGGMAEITIHSKDPGDSIDITRAGKLEDLDRLLSLMIHQIRNHCMSIKGYASLLNYEDDVSTKGKKWISNISRGIGSLEGFLSVFETYRMAKKFTLERLDLNLLVRNAWKSAIEMFGIDIIAPELEINIIEGTEIDGDRHDFRKMMLHIFRNSIESMDGTGRVKVFVGPQDPENAGNNGWIIEIQDDGCGMDRGEVMKAGEILYSTKTSHIGCGLNLVAAVASRMNAIVEVRSEKGVGSLVRIKEKSVITE